MKQQQHQQRRAKLSPVRRRRGRWALLAAGGVCGAAAAAAAAAGGVSEFGNVNRRQKRLSGNFAFNVLPVHSLSERVVVVVVCVVSFSGLSFCPPPCKRSSACPSVRPFLSARENRALLSNYNRVER